MSHPGHALRRSHAAVNRRGERARRRLEVPAQHGAVLRRLTVPAPAGSGYRVTVDIPESLH